MYSLSARRKSSFLLSMNNVSSVNNCYGCGVCAASCPRNIISIELNGDGFYFPRILNPNDCVECGICVNVCSFRYEECALVDRKIKSWAAWSNDDEVRIKCSSGGVSFEIGRQLINQGYKVVGCRYNIDKQIAEHYIATTVDELIQSIGSKYIQSYTADAFKKIKRRGEKYLVTGTPCQIDSFRRMIRKFKCEDNFVLLDFFCHSVPSMLAWRAYIKMLEPKIGKVTYASWRNKFEYGGHDSWLMGMDGVKTSSPINWHDSYNMLIREKKLSYNPVGLKVIGSIECFLVIIALENTVRSVANTNMTNLRLILGLAIYGVKLMPKMKKV